MVCHCSTCREAGRKRCVCFASKRATVREEEGMMKSEKGGEEVVKDEQGGMVIKKEKGEEEVVKDEQGGMAIKKEKDTGVEALREELEAERRAKRKAEEDLETERKKRWRWQAAIDQEIEKRQKVEELLEKERELRKKAEEAEAKANENLRGLEMEYNRRVGKMEGVLESSGWMKEDRVWRWQGKWGGKGPKGEGEGGKGWQSNSKGKSEGQAKGGKGGKTEGQAKAGKGGKTEASSDS